MSIQGIGSQLFSRGAERSSGVEQFGKIVDKRLNGSALDGGLRKTDTVSETAKQRIAAFDFKKFAEHLA